MQAWVHICLKGRYCPQDILASRKLSRVQKVKALFLSCSEALPTYTRTSSVCGQRQVSSHKLCLPLHLWNGLKKVYFLSKWMCLLVRRTWQLSLFVCLFQTEWSASLTHTSNFINSTWLLKAWLAHGVSTADMSTLQKPCRNGLIPSSYKKYISQLKIVLRTDVMLLWLSRETHESVTGRWGQSVNFGLFLGYLKVTLYPGPRRQLTLWLPHLSKAGVTSWIQTNQSWSRKVGVGVDTYVCVDTLQPSSFLRAHVHPYLGSCGCCLYSLGK